MKSENNNIVVIAVVDDKVNGMDVETTLVLLGNKYYVPTTKLKDSELYSSLLDGISSSSSGTSVINLPLPDGYEPHIIEDYVYYLRSATNSVNNMKSSLQLCHLITDGNYLQHLVERLLVSWSVYSNMVSTLNTNLQQDIYVNLPLALIPEPQLHDVVFVKRWLAKHKETMVRNHVIVVEDISYTHDWYNTMMSKNINCYADGEQCLNVSWLLAEEHYTDELGHQTVRTTKDISTIDLYTQHSGNNIAHGIFKGWWPNGQLRLSALFENNDIVGTVTRWESDGTLSTINYNSYHTAIINR